MLSDSDLSDAPDDITFQESKEASTKLKQGHAAHEKNLKKERKLKNKQRDELFSEQKKAKMSRLAATRLPDDVLNALPDDADNVSDGPEVETLPLQMASHTQFSSDDEQDETDSGINSTITSKITVKEVQAIKSKAFISALAFKSLKESGCHEGIRRQSARDAQLIREKRRIKNRR